MNASKQFSPEEDKSEARHGTARHGTGRHGTARHGTAPIGVFIKVYIQELLYKSIYRSVSKLHLYRSFYKIVYI